MKHYIEDIIETIVCTLYVLILACLIISVPIVFYYSTPYNGKVIEKDYKNGRYHVVHRDAESALKLLEVKDVELVNEYDHPDHYDNVFVFEKQQ